MKKVLTLLLALILLLSLCSCSENAVTSTDPQRTDPPAADHTDPPTSTSSDTTQHPTSGGTEDITPPTDAPSNATSNEGPTDSPPTEGPTDVPSNAPTVAPTEGPTDAPSAEAPTDAPASCIHSYKDATCTEPKTCSKCGATEGDAAGHSHKDATCTEPKACSKCGATEGDAAGHRYKDATCTEPKTCAKCGHALGVTLPHNYQNRTCTSCGSRELGYGLWQAYKLVGDTLEIIELSSSGPNGGMSEHIYLDITSNIEQVQQAIEYGSSTIKYQGKTYIRYTAAGNLFYYEDIEENSITVRFDQNKFTLQRKSPNQLVVTEVIGCNWPGIVPDMIFTYQLYSIKEGCATGHNWAEATCTTPKTCTKCEATQGKAEGHNWSEATCTAPKACGKCGTTEGTALGHTLTEICERCDAINSGYRSFASSKWAYTIYESGDIFMEYTLRTCGFSTAAGWPMALEVTRYTPIETFAAKEGTDVDAIKQQVAAGIYPPLKIKNGTECICETLISDCSITAKDSQDAVYLDIYNYATGGTYSAYMVRTGLAEFTVTGGNFSKLPVGTRLIYAGS